MRTTFDLSALEWTLSGFNPEQWRSRMTMETNVAVCEDVPPVTAKVPGSVQGALLAAGLLPDWKKKRGLSPVPGMEGKGLTGGRSRGRSRRGRR